MQSFYNFELENRWTKLHFLWIVMWSINFQTFEVSMFWMTWTKPLDRGVRWCFNTCKFLSLANFCESSNFSGLSRVPSAKSSSQMDEGYDANAVMPFVNVCLSFSQFLARNIKSLIPHAHPIVGTYCSIFLAITRPFPNKKKKTFKIQTNKTLACYIVLDTFCSILMN